MTPTTTYDVVIVRSGPAGLSTALTLGQARRATLLVDDGPGRREVLFTQL